LNVGLNLPPRHDLVLIRCLDDARSADRRL
jgi:hypothetical protein